MKTKLFSFWLVLLIAIFGLNANAQVHVNAKFYVNIPLAPNFNLEIAVNTHHRPAPHDRYVWVDNYYAWDYTIGSYVLVQGGWVLPPYPDAIWIPGYWEYTPYGYSWMSAGWLPQHYHMSYGFYKDRYDYYGRPVYYHQPHRIEPHHCYAYGYDHNPEHRGQHFSSSSFHNTPSDKPHSNTSKERVSSDNHRTSAGTRASANNRTATSDRTSANTRTATSDRTATNNKEAQSTRNSNVENKDRVHNSATSSSNESDRKSVVRTTPSSSKRASSGSDSSSDSKKNRSNRTR